MSKKTKKLPVRTSNQKRSVIASLTHNPLFVAILSGIVVTLAIWCFREYKSEKTAKTALKARVNNADEFLAKNRIYDALATYQDILKRFSVRKYPGIYARIRNNEGVCYYELAKVSDKEKNLSRAIGAYEEALKIYAVEKYPLDYERIMSNMRKAKKKLQSSP